MKNIKEIYEVLNYQINPYVLKGLKTLNVTIDEILILIYFMNVKNVLDLIDINEKLSLSEEEALNAYSSLLSKGIIEVKMEKKDGKISESISLEGLYNKLVLEQKEESSKSDIYSKFEKEFGKTLSPIEYETINRWLENGIKEEIIESALKEAVINGVTNLRYIDKIIYDWTKNNSSKEREDYQELYDYDWLGDNDD